MLFPVYAIYIVRAVCICVCCSLVLSACQINVGGRVSCSGGESEVLGVPGAKLGGRGGFRKRGVSVCMCGERRDGRDRHGRHGHNV